jgi:hypothetical protein
MFSRQCGLPVNVSSLRVALWFPRFSISNLKEVTSASACTSHQGYECFPVNMYFPSNPMKITPSLNSLNTVSFYIYLKLICGGDPCAELGNCPWDRQYSHPMKGPAVLPQKGSHMDATWPTTWHPCEHLASIMRTSREQNARKHASTHANRSTQQ